MLLNDKNMPTKTSPWPARLIVLISGLFLFFLVLHLAGVASLRYFVERELHPALPTGTYIGDVHLNLFDGSLKIDDFVLRNDGEVRARFGKLQIQITPWRLATGTDHVGEAALRQAYLRVDRREDGSFDLGMPPFGTEGPPEADSEPPDVRIDSVILDRVTIEYHDGELASAVYIDTVETGAYVTLEDPQTVPVSWSLHWDTRAIEGQAEIGLEAGEVSATGQLKTEPLDIGRAQQLARVAPAATGEVAFEGPFDWQPPRLTVSGSLAAPRLAYEADGQAVGIDGLQAPDTALELLTEPTLQAALNLASPLMLNKASWQAQGQGAEIAAFRLCGATSYADGGGIEAKGMTLGAERLAWHDATRDAALAGVELAGALQQALGEAACLPTLDINLKSSSVQLRDSGQALDLKAADLAIDKLALTAGGGEPGRGFSMTISVGAIDVAQQTTRVASTGLQAQLNGRLADQTALGGDVRLTGITVADPTLANGPLRVKGLAAESLTINGTQTAFDRIRLDGIALPGTMPQTGLLVVGLELGQDRYADSRGVTLGEIIVDGINTGVIRDKTGNWQHVMSVAGSSGSPTSKSAEKNKDTSNPLPWRIGGLRVVGGSYITVADRLNTSADPVRFAIEKLVVGRLASSEPRTDTTFDVVLRPDKFAEFRVGGVVRPLADKLYRKAKGHLQGFGLSTVNGLVADDLGHRFLEGQLDDDFTITIDNNRLDMGNALALSDLKVE